jgi:nucleotide-binding universal stress UspA family protein
MTVSHLLFSKLLVAVDGSESAKRAFTKSVYLAKQCKSRLDIIHVVLGSTYGGDSAATFLLIEELKERGRKLLEDYKTQAKRDGVQPETLLEVGDHAQVIIDIANKEGYDLIIMGSRGLSLFKDLLLGSVSFKVMHHARCAVMVVR